MTGDEAQANKALMAQILRDYGQGDLRTMLAALAEDVTWQSHAQQSHYRFGGLRRGREGVVEALALAASEYAIQRMRVKELVAEGRTVWSLCELEYLHTTTNTPPNFVIASHWVLHGGKIKEIETFFDTASLLAQQGRLAAS